MSMKKDFYEILGVPRSASKNEIKAAYKKIALKYHPDRLHGKSDSEKQAAESKFKEASEAYSVLSNEQKRQSYDNFGDHNAAGHNPFEGFGGFGQGADFPDLNDILNSFFGGGGGESGPSSFQGEDLGYSLTLSLEDAASGIEKEINIRKNDSCDSCHGSGGKAGSKPTRCGTCGGRGRVAIQQGFMAIQQTCPNCQGQGSTISDPCNKCRGKGCYPQSCRIKVRIPAGVDNGDRMRVSGKGDAGQRGALPGDLYISINVAKHDLFERDGVHLHCNVPISFYQACVGGEMEIPTLDGAVKLKIPSETQSGSLLRLRQKGIKSVKSNQIGDIICHIVVETPVKLTKEQIGFIEQFNASITKNQTQQPKAKSFFNRIKTMLKN